MRFQIGWLPPVEKSRAPLTDIHVFSTTRPVWLMNVTCQSVGLPWLSNTHTNEQQTARLCPQKFAKTSPTVRQQRRAAAAAAFTFHLPPDLLINKSCGSIWLMSLTSELISRQRRHRRWLFHIKIPASNGKFFGEIHYVMRCVHYGDGGNRMRVVCIRRKPIWCSPSLPRTSIENCRRRRGKRRLLGSFPFGDDKMRKLSDDLAAAKPLQRTSSSP